MLAQIPHGRVDVCIVPVGGGGLIAGIAAVLKAACPGCLVVGAQPAASDVMRQSVAAGSIVDVPSGDTLSDATAGERVCAINAQCCSTCRSNASWSAGIVEWVAKWLRGNARTIAVHNTGIGGASVVGSCIAQLL
jgi:threonine dehydratase